MLSCFAVDATAAATPVVELVRAAGFAEWVAAQGETTRRWLTATGFEPKARKLALFPNRDGEISGGVFVLDGKSDAGAAAALAMALPQAEQAFRVRDPEVLIAPFDLYYGWALASYRFKRYQLSEEVQDIARLAVADEPESWRANELARSVFLARDMINTPANDMGPAELEAVIRVVAEEFGARVETIEGEALLAANYPAIHAVGRASTRAPRLIDLAWGDPAAPKLTLVGKGVCFDTGGLDIKPSAGMRQMKKDMGGAACMTGLARMIMAVGLPVRLRLLVPAVENSIAGSAFRPGDVLETRKGLSVEVGNTDAEGRLVLADALAEADAERPEMLLDAATLTGAARVALGTNLPALFAKDDETAEAILAAGRGIGEPLWRLPLHPAYRELIKSQIADLSSTGSKPMGGAITAALFLERFVEATSAWAHLDIFAWNDESRPGRRKGGEATGLRALFSAIEQRFGDGRRG